MNLRSYLIAGAAAIGMALPTAAAAQALAQVTTDLNLRSGPGTNHGIITAMPRGAQVAVHQCPGSWCQVTYGGVTGWASHRYLSGAVAMQPRTRTYAVTPEPRVRFGFGVGPRYRDYGPRYRYGSRYHGRNAPPGWHDDGVFGDRSWYYDDDRDIGPSTGFSLRFGS